jgi:beta-glucosidase
VVAPGNVDLWLGGGQPGGAHPAAGAALRVTVGGKAEVPAF